MYYIRVFDNVFLNERRILNEGNDFIAQNSLQVSEFLDSTDHKKYVIVKV